MNYKGLTSPLEGSLLSTSQCKSTPLQEIRLNSQRIENNIIATNNNSKTSITVVFSQQ